MARKPREISSTDLYHCVYRGTNRQTLFEARHDYQRYLDLIQKVKRKIDFELHAYCLMSNHVHMLIKAPYKELSRLSQCINTSYARFYNHKYSCTGHLFEPRFGSTPVESHSHHINTIRYIHQNPVHAGIIKNAEAHKYTWSSLKEFKCHADKKTSSIPNSLCDAPIVAAIFDDKLETSLDNFFEFHSVVSKSGAYENEDHRLTDEEAKDLLTEAFGDRMEYIKNLQKLSIDERNHYLVEIKKLNISVNQISRLTGIGRNIIQRAK